MLQRVCLFAALASLFPGPPALAAVFSVPSTSDLADVAPGDGVCDANPTVAVASAPCARRCRRRSPLPRRPDLAACRDLRAPDRGDRLDGGAAGDLDVASGSTLTGSGSGVTVIDQSAADRVFEVRPSANSCWSE